MQTSRVPHEREQARRLHHKSPVGQRPPAPRLNNRIMHIPCRESFRTRSDRRCKVALARSQRAERIFDTKVDLVVAARDAPPPRSIGRDELPSPNGGCLENDNIKLENDDLRSDSEYE